MSSARRTQSSAWKPAGSGRPASSSPRLELRVLDRRLDDVIAVGAMQLGVDRRGIGLHADVDVGEAGRLQRAAGHLHVHAQQQAGGVVGPDHVVEAAVVARLQQQAVGVVAGDAFHRLHVQLVEIGDVLLAAAHQRRERRARIDRLDHRHAVARPQRAHLVVDAQHRARLAVERIDALQRVLAFAVVADARADDAGAGAVDDRADVAAARGGVVDAREPAAQVAGALAAGRGLRRRRRLLRLRARLAGAERGGAHQRAGKARHARQPVARATARRARAGARGGAGAGPWTAPAPSPRGLHQGDVADVAARHLERAAHRRLAVRRQVRRELVGRGLALGDRLRAVCPWRRRCC
jgi:hypothetical protein